MASSKYTDCALSANFTAESLKEAQKTAEDTHNAIRDLFIEWLNITHLNDPNATPETVLEHVNHKYSLHKLNMDYPLRAEVNDSDFSGSTGKTDHEDIHRIQSSLDAIHHALKQVKETDKKFDHFKEMLNHNRHNVSEFMDCPIDAGSAPEFNDTHPSLGYAVVKEMCQLLEVVAKIYSRMLDEKMQGSR